MRSYHPRCGETSSLFCGETIAESWPHESQPSVNRSMMLGFGAVSSSAMSELLEFYMYKTIYDPVIGPYGPGVRRDLDVCPSGNSRQKPAGSRMSPS